jgi:hypothetical protein
VRVTESELIVYGPGAKQIAWHEPYPPGTTGEKHPLPAHSRGRDQQQKRELLAQRFAEFDSDGIDPPFPSAAPHPGACSQLSPFLLARRVERTLGALAKPRSVMETLVIDARQQLDEILRQTPLPPQPTADYQLLLEKTVDEESNEDKDHGPEDSTA